MARQLRQTSRAHPRYYEVLVIGYQDFGRSIASFDVPPKKDMLKIIIKLLVDVSCADVRP